MSHIRRAAQWSKLRILSIAKPSLSTTSAKSKTTVVWVDIRIILHFHHLPVHLGLFWTTSPRHNLASRPTPHMYDAINKYVILISEYFSDIISNWQRRSLTIQNCEIMHYLSKFTIRQWNFCISRLTPSPFLCFLLKFYHNIQVFQTPHLSLSLSYIIICHIPTPYHQQQLS